MPLQLDEDDCGLRLGALRLDQRDGRARSLQRAVLLNGGLENDLRERRRNGLEHQAVDDAGRKQADQAALIARAADRDYHECRLCIAQLLRHAP